MTFSADHAASVLPPCSKWWQCIFPDFEASIRLWFFPCIGAGAAIWRPWTGPLAGAAELFAVCLPGRESRLDEAPATRIEALATALAAEFELHSGERDVFLGHGLGALLAFEVARRLRRDGAPGPRGLVVCGQVPPDRPASAQPLHRLSPREFKSAVERRYGGIPAEFLRCPEALEFFLPVLRADLEALETYAYSDAFDKLDIPILAIAGSADALVSGALLSGWRDQTTSWFQSAQVAGSHFVVTENVFETAARVRIFLAAL